jgi:hypothetical protein
MVMWDPSFACRSKGHIESAVQPSPFNLHPSPSGSVLPTRVCGSGNLFSPRKCPNAPTTVLTSSLPPRYLPTFFTMDSACLFQACAISCAAAVLIPNSSIHFHPVKTSPNSPIATQPDVPKICRTSLFCHRPDLLADQRFVSCPHSHCSFMGYASSSCTVRSSRTDMIHVVVTIEWPPKRVSCPRAYIPSRSIQIGDVLPQHRQPGAIVQTG